MRGYLSLHEGISVFIHMESCMRSRMRGCIIRYFSLRERALFWALIIAPASISTCAPQRPQGQGGVKPTVERVGGRRITRTGTIWKEVRKCSGGFKNTLDPPACGAPAWHPSPLILFDLRSQASA